MKHAVRGMLCGLLVGGVVALAASLADARPAQKYKKHQRTDAPAGTEVLVHVSFSPRDVQVLREYYAPRYRALPPGLQKKLRRTGQLPPGWQKKFEPFPVAIERQLVVLPAGYRRGVIDGHAVIFNSRTQVIFDVAVLF